MTRGRPGDAAPPPSPGRWRPPRPGRSGGHPVRRGPRGPEGAPARWAGHCLRRPSVRRRDRRFAGKVFGALEVARAWHREPADLEGAVALDEAPLVVVDGFAGPGEQPGGHVVVGQDQHGVLLVAGKGDPHAHLSHRRSIQRVGAAERLGPEQHVHPEGTPLSDEAVEEERRILADLVVVDEELLELVDHEEDPRHRLLGTTASPAREVLDALRPESLASRGEFLVESLQHGEAEFAIALDGHGACVREPVGGVGLELDALLEVDEMELDLVGRVPAGEVRDEGVSRVDLPEPVLRVARAGRFLVPGRAPGAATRCGRVECGSRPSRRATRSPPSVGAMVSNGPRPARRRPSDALHQVDERRVARNVVEGRRVQARHREVVDLPQPQVQRRLLEDRGSKVSKTRPCDRGAAG